jgi:hypothetical protein
VRNKPALVGMTSTPKKKWREPMSLRENMSPSCWMKVITELDCSLLWQDHQHKQVRSKDWSRCFKWIEKSLPWSCGIPSEE